MSSRKFVNSSICELQQKKPGFIAWLSVYPRSESNRDRQNRYLKFYPLNYRGIRLGTANLAKITDLQAYFAHFLLGSKPVSAKS